MTPTANLADMTERTRQMTTLTERLTERLGDELAAFEARRPQDVAATVHETQAMANQYRRESARMKADRALLERVPGPDRSALAQATRAFEAVLTRHARAVEAARVISEGLVKAIAAEVAEARNRASGYGAGGRAQAVDGRAVTFNRTA